MLSLSIRRSIVNVKYDFLMIVFPVAVPLLFFVLMQLFSINIEHLFLIVFCLLGETHFANTWHFFLDKSNSTYLYKNKFVYLYVPMMICCFLLCLWLLSYHKLIFGISAAASSFHVTRQSIGVHKIYSEDFKVIRKYTYFGIYFISAFCVLFGFMKYFSNINIHIYENSIVTIGSASFILLCLLGIYKSRNLDSKNKLNFLFSFFTGMLIYLPYLYVQKIELAAVYGISMHWLQYSALVMPVYYRKYNSIQQPFMSRKSAFWNIIKLFMFTLTYAVIMLYFRLGNHGLQVKNYSNYFIIPLILQALHYYYDAFMWRFSDPHIKKSVGTYLFTKHT